MEDKLKETLKEFESEFTYIDKEGYPRLSNKSPRRLKGWIKSKLIEANTRHVELDEEKLEVIARETITDILWTPLGKVYGMNHMLEPQGILTKVEKALAKAISKNINQIVTIKKGE